MDQNGKLRHPSFKGLGEIADDVNFFKLAGEGCESAWSRTGDSSDVARSLASYGSFDVRLSRDVMI